MVCLPKCSICKLRIASASKVTVNGCFFDFLRMRCRMLTGCSPPFVQLREQATNHTAATSSCVSPHLGPCYLSPIKNDRPQLAHGPSLHSAAGLEERVRKIQKRAAQAGFDAGGAASPETDKAFMDELWGED